MSKESQQEWLELCQYVHDEILQYNSSLKISKHFILRLRGLNKGQFIANKKSSPQAEYPYPVILLTFKAKKHEIQYALKNNAGNFKDENHKVNYIMSIIENSINDIIMRMKQKQETETKLDELNLESTLHDKADYKSKNKKNKVSEKLEGLW